MAAAVVCGAFSIGSIYALNRIPFFFPPFGTELDPEKKERVQAMLRQVGYTDLSKVKLRQYDGEDVIAAGGGNNALMVIPRHFTASPDDTINSLYPSLTSHQLSNLLVADLDRDPSLREKLMENYGIFVKTSKECDHLLAFSGAQLFRDDGWTICKVQAIAIMAVFSVLGLMKKRKILVIPPVMYGCYLANWKITAKVHKESLFYTLDTMGSGTAEDAIKLSKAEQQYNLKIRRPSEFLGRLLITSSGDDLSLPPSVSQRLHFLDEYQRQRTTNFDNRDIFLEK